MPVLPTYDSSQNINTTPAGVQRDIADQPFKAIEHLNNTVMDITQKMSNANDVMQETKAKTEHSGALLQAELAAQQDPNPDNAESHIKAINDINKNAANGIDNQEVAGRVKLELQHDSFLSQIKIQDMFVKKRMLQNDVNLDKSNVTDAQLIVNAATPAAAQQILDNRLKTINQNYSVGAISQERGVQLSKGIYAEVAKAQISKSSSTNIDDYKSLVPQGVDAKESNEFMKMAEAHIKQVEEGNITNTFDNRVKILGGVASKQIDWKSADKINAIAAKDPALGSALHRHIFDLLC